MGTGDHCRLQRLVDEPVSRPFCIGLTGGIGSGKTAATDIFSRLGTPIIDADTISQEVVMAGQPALSDITDTFGADVIGEDGELRRSYLRKLIFDDIPARQKLESIIHPRVRDEITRRLQHIRYPYCIISSPLLIESHSLDNIDRIVVIDAPEPLQIERASNRDQLQKEEINKIVNSQISRHDRLSVADDVIVNEKDLSFLQKQVEVLHRKYLKIATEGVTQ